jgi:hypothetical protein
MVLSSFDPDQIANSLLAAGNDYADKNAAADALENTVKSIEGKHFLDAEGNVEERKATARNRQEYKEYAAKATEARRLALRAKVYYDTLKVKVDLLRTLESTKRAEMGLR